MATARVHGVETVLLATWAFNASRALGLIRALGVLEVFRVLVPSFFSFVFF